MIDEKNLAFLNYLDAALDELFTLRVMLGGVPSDLKPPLGALDAALAVHKEHREWRSTFKVLIQDLLAELPEGHPRDLIFRLEEATNALCATSTEAGWKVARSRKESD